MFVRYVWSTLRQGLANALARGTDADEHRLVGACIKGRGERFVVDTAIESTGDEYEWGIDEDLQRGDRWQHRRRESVIDEAQRSRR
jgi:hypothetical protein